MGIGDARFSSLEDINTYFQQEDKEMPIEEGVYLANIFFNSNFSSTTCAKEKVEILEKIRTQLHGLEDNSKSWETSRLERKVNSLIGEVKTRTDFSCERTKPTFSYERTKPTSKLGSFKMALAKQIAPIGWRLEYKECLAEKAKVRQELKHLKDEEKILQTAPGKLGIFGRVKLYRLHGKIETLNAQLKFLRVRAKL